MGLSSRIKKEKEKMAGRKKTAAAGGSTKQKKEQEQYLISELDQYLFGQGTHLIFFVSLARIR